MFDGRGDRVNPAVQHDMASHGGAEKHKCERSLSM
jgi:hypothetical protein